MEERTLGLPHRPEFAEVLQQVPLRDEVEAHFASACYSAFLFSLSMSPISFFQNSSSGTAGSQDADEVFLFDSASLEHLLHRRTAERVMNRDCEDSGESRMDELMVAASDPQEGPTHAFHRSEKPPAGYFARQLRQLDLHLENLRAHWRPLAPLPEGFQVEGDGFASEPDRRLLALGIGDDVEPWHGGHVVPRFGVVLNDHGPLHASTFPRSHLSMPTVPHWVPPEAAPP